MTTTLPSGRQVISLLWVLMLSAGATRGLDAKTRPEGARSPKTPIEEESAETGISLEYTIGPGDVLKISVWKEVDFSADVTVRLDGKITLPLAGDIVAAGRTPEQLGTDLEQKLTDFIELPQVTVSIVGPNSARYFVIGKVQTQGAFPYTGPLRVVQALALAGGFQDFAKKGDIFVLREVDGKQISLPVQYGRLEDGKDLGVNIRLLPGDTIIVP